MIIEQTVEITSDRRLTIDVPAGVPEGKARVEVRVTQFVKKGKNGEKMLGEIRDERLAAYENDNRQRHLPVVESLSGILSEGDLDMFAAEDERARYILKK